VKGRIAGRLAASPDYPYRPSERPAGRQAGDSDLMTKARLSLNLTARTRLTLNGEEEAQWILRLIISVADQMGA
jgi:hypothetical protein